MINQKYGAIYNVEGHGSNNATIDKLTVYGTAKRGVTYFTESLAHELKPYNITVGKITPGIMITNFIYHSLGDGKELQIDDKTKKIYNILGDYRSKAGMSVEAQAAYRKALEIDPNNAQAKSKLTP